VQEGADENDDDDTHFSQLLELLATINKDIEKMKGRV
jgi:hypothetical protein